MWNPSGSAAALRQCVGSGSKTNAEKREKLPFMCGHVHIMCGLCDFPQWCPNAIPQHAFALVSVLWFKDTFILFSQLDSSRSKYQPQCNDWSRGPTKLVQVFRLWGEFTSTQERCLTFNWYGFAISLAHGLINWKHQSKMSSSKKLTCEGTLRQLFISLRPPLLLWVHTPPPLTVTHCIGTWYVYTFTRSNYFYLWERPLLCLILSTFLRALNCTTQKFLWLTRAQSLCMFVQVCPSCRAFFRRSVQSGYNATYFCIKAKFQM